MYCCCMRHDIVRCIIMKYRPRRTPKSAAYSHLKPSLSVWNNVWQPHQNPRNCASEFILTLIKITKNNVTVYLEVWCRRQNRTQNPCCQSCAIAPTFCFCIRTINCASATSEASTLNISVLTMRLHALQNVRASTHSQNRLPKCGCGCSVESSAENTLSREDDTMLPTFTGMAHYKKCLYMYQCDSL